MPRQRTAISKKRRWLGGAAGSDHGAPERQRGIRGVARNLYFWVFVAVALGILVGAVSPDLAQQVKFLGTAFVALIKMLIAPIIFCTIVLGIASVRDASTVGRVAGKAFAYFFVVSTLALILGLVVGEIARPGDGFALGNAATESLPLAGEQQGGLMGFVLNIIPTSLLSSFTSGKVLQVVFVALLVGFALQRMGAPGAKAVEGVRFMSKLCFKLLSMVLVAAPIGAFGAIAGVVGSVGLDALTSLGYLIIVFYLTCIGFIFIILAGILRAAGLNIFKLLIYLKQELLLIGVTMSSESALPRLLEKLEHLGASRSVVGITVPTGYSFNLDGSAMYLTLTYAFIAQASGHSMGFGEQLSLLIFMLIASKGAAGVAGAGLATLSASIEASKPQFLPGLGVVVGIDRFMDEARALTNFIGNSVATIVVARWEGEFDMARAKRVLSGELPFNEEEFLRLSEEGFPEVHRAPEPSVPAPVS